jgi:hypothetical protein
VSPQDSKQPFAEEGEEEEEDGSHYESPIQKRYKYPQQYREYTIPPQLDGEGENVLIRNQPRRRVHKSPELPTQYEDEVLDMGSGVSGSDDSEDPGVNFVDRGKRPSLCRIERSPESTLKRGEYLTFPGKKMSISVLRPLDASLLQKIEALKPECSPELSGIHFSLYFDEHKEVLVLHVDCAVHIPIQRPEVSSPFLQVYLLPSKLEVQQSLSTSDSHNPVFDRVFRFSNISLDQIKQQLLVMRLYVNINHFVGGVVYSLEEEELVGNMVVKEIEAYDEEGGLKVREIEMDTQIVPLPLSPLPPPFPSLPPPLSPAPPLPPLPTPPHCFSR